MRPIIFPTLADAEWREVDLDALARSEFPQDGPNPLNDPEVCGAWIASVGRRVGGLTYGGYLEDRRTLWRGHYHDPERMRHLGVDYNVPAGTPVAAPAPCEVVRAIACPPEQGGWGGLVFFRLDTPYRAARWFLYGHLAHRDLPAVGARFAAGERIGTVGLPHENGGWFAHLHVQCFDDTEHDAYAPELERMDGYGDNPRTVRPENPDPTGLCAGAP